MSCQPRKDRGSYRGTTSEPVARDVKLFESFGERSYSRLKSKILQCVQLVAVEAGAVGKAAEKFVLPFRGKPGLRGCVPEFLELPARSAHVGRRAEDNGIGGIKRHPSVLGKIALGVDGMKC